jgi:RNA polymerase-binding transcription factor DksA
MEDFGELQQQLTSKREELEDRLRRIAQDRQRARKALDPDFEEQAVERENDEVLDALDQTIRAELDEINKALARLKRGEYGTCAVCGTAIPVKRLKALPYTDRCVSCAEKG